MAAPSVWKGAGQGPVAQAQRESSHGCVCCCPSTGPGMGPLGAAKGSPRCTCTRQSAAPVAASPHNTLRCAFIPLAQTLERRWGKPSLNTLTPAAVSLASLVAFFNQPGKGALQSGDPSNRCPVSKRAVRPVPDAGGSPGALQSPPSLADQLCVCMGGTHARGNCFLPPLPHHRPDTLCRELVTCCKLGS